MEEFAIIAKIFEPWELTAIVNMDGPNHAACPAFKTAVTPELAPYITDEAIVVV